MRNLTVNIDAIINNSAIILISYILNISPKAFFTSLGAAAALLTFLFKDSVVGLLASFQIISYDIIRIGDYVKIAQLNVEDILDEFQELGRSAGGEHELDSICKYMSTGRSDVRQHQFLESEEDVKSNLAAAYQILAILGLDDHTYTHLSARVTGSDCYYIYPFGLRFEDVTPNNLLKVSLEGVVLEGSEHSYNKTGYILHGNIYKTRKDINAIFHLHTPATVAVSSICDGLLPISQWALHFYDRLSYHEYDSLVLSAVQGNEIVDDLGKNYVMLLRNHGMLTCGRTIHEAMFYTYHLEQACKTQCLALSTNQKLIVPSAEICKKSVQDLLAFEEDLGKRDWLAWLNLLKKKNSYKNIAAQKVKEITGRELKINGDITVALLPTPTIKVKSVSLSSVRGATTYSLLEVKEVSAALSLVSLLKGDINIATIDIYEPILNLERLPNGSASWELSASSNKLITDNNITEVNERKDYSIEGNIQEKQGIITFNSDLNIFKEKIIISGDLRRDDMSYNGKFNNVSYHNQDLFLHDLDLATEKASLKGDIGFKNWSKNMFITYDFKISELSAFANLFALNLPANLNHIAIKGEASKEKEKIKISNMLTFAKTAVNGNIDINLKASKPEISSDIKVTSLNLNELLSNSPVNNQIVKNNASSPSNVVNSTPWSKNKLDLSFLRKMDGDLVFDTIKSTMSLSNGVLNIKSLSGRLYGGNLKATGRLSADKDQEVSFKVNLTGAELRNIIKQQGKIKVTKGNVNFTGDIKTSGHSQLQYISNLFGNVNLTAAEGGETNFQNLMVAADIKEGIASITHAKLTAEATDVTAKGKEEKSDEMSSDQDSSPEDKNPLKELKSIGKDNDSITF
ncbi:putative aldolase class 2 protein [Pseudolycoriella hygida]|uniref:Aldolase class 2 protein n=1 Tax=Pseudolycoriella hygida TaxID=35572 RepID=A0A9Q0S696_9DIPT|nr:putative aldolase class 2 protein [Pseudolycoriella hygida]